MSWFHGYALIRTYSNSLETFFLIIGLFLVGKEFLGRQPGASFPTCLAFYLGGICCSIRFTCLASFVPMGLILSLQRRSTIKFLFGFCLIPGLLGLGTTLLIDRYMYGFWAIPVLGNIPLLGRLFQSSAESYSKRNLLIFVSASIVSRGGSPVREVIQNISPQSIFKDPVIMTPTGTIRRTPKGGAPVAAP